MKKSRLCTICARGGSKGVINKNIRNISGKPLIVYSIEQALRSKLFEHIVVSTDSESISEISIKYGAEVFFKRPAELSLDTSPKIPVIRHALMSSEEYYNKVFDTIVDLDATSPLRSVDDILNCVSIFEDKKYGNLITAMNSRRSPYFNLIEVNDKGIVSLSEKSLIPIVRRQDAPSCFDMNASIYIWNRNSLLNREGLFHEDTGLYVMPEERSIDIDSELDFELVEFLIKKKINVG